MKKQILVVEDDSAIMETLTIFLQYEGYDVLRARSAERACELLNEANPDLVLLDYMLQDGTAEPVVEAVRARFGEMVAVILLTAAEDPIGKARDAGADSVVAKPFELDILLQKVRESFDNTRSSGSGRGQTAGLIATL